MDSDMGNLRGSSNKPGSLAPNVPMVLDASHVSVSFRNGRRRTSEVIHDLGLGMQRQQVTVLLGESGSGKTVFARSVIGAPPRGAITSGRSVFDGFDLMSASRRKLQTVRGKRISWVTQDPQSALDPMRRIGSQISEVLMQHRMVSSKSEAMHRAEALLEAVEIRESAEVLKLYPYELSGGMRQRVSIAIAISCEPELVVADEPSSALDASVGARVVDLLNDLRRKLGTAILFITHDIGVAQRIASEQADRVAVMLNGNIVELGYSTDVIQNPAHPYTQVLLEAEPSRYIPRGKLATVPEYIRQVKHWGPLTQVSPGHGVSLDDLSLKVSSK